VLRDFVNVLKAVNNAEAEKNIRISPRN